MKSIYLNHYKLTITTQNGCHLPNWLKSIFNIAKLNHKFYFIVAINDDDFSVISIPLGASKIAF